MLLQTLVLFFLAGVPLLFAGVVAAGLAHVYHPLSDVGNLLWVIFFTLVALLLGFCLVLLALSFLAGLLWPLLRPKAVSPPRSGTEGPAAETG